MTPIETRRLLITALGPSDAPFILELVNTPGWLKYIGDRNIHDMAAAEAYILNGPVRSYSQYGYGLFLVSLKENQLPAGICGILKRDTLPSPDLGFAFLPQYNGQGYAQEAAIAVINDAWKQHGLETILAITLETNLSSIKLLDKLGFMPERKMPAEGNNAELLVYKLAKPS